MPDILLWGLVAFAGLAVVGYVRYLLAKFRKRKEKRNRA